MTLTPPQIVITFDGLTSTAFGCYGSSWCDTTAIDSIAARGIVWDRLIAHSDNATDLLATWLKPNSPWISDAKKTGELRLVTDAKQFAESEIASVFNEITLTQNDSVNEKPQAEIESTRFGRIIAESLEVLSDQSRPCGLLWLHSDFLSRCWDAPRDLVSVDWDNEETAEPMDDATRVALESIPTEQRLESLPNTFESTEVPEVELSKSDHPDWIITWMRTYACQVRLVDGLIAVLMESAQTILGCKISDIPIVLTSTGGFSLGQNGFIARRKGLLRSCHIQLPLIVAGQGPLRIPTVTSSAEIVDQLQRQRTGDSVEPDSWSLPLNEFDPLLKTQCGDGVSATTCNRWFMVEDDVAIPKLFLKPDDLNEVNDVARLRPDVVDRLHSIR